MKRLFLLVAFFAAPVYPSLPRVEGSPFERTLAALVRYELAHPPSRNDCGDNPASLTPEDYNFNGHSTCYHGVYVESSVSASARDLAEARALQWLELFGTRYMEYPVVRGRQFLPDQYDGMVEYDVEDQHDTMTPEPNQIVGVCYGRVYSTEQLKADPYLGFGSLCMAPGYLPTQWRSRVRLEDVPAVLKMGGKIIPSRYDYPAPMGIPVELLLRARELRRGK